MYCHFYRRKFEIDNFNEIQSIKGVPGHVFINDLVTIDDLEYTEAALYKARYIFFFFFECFEMLFVDIVLKKISKEKMDYGF